LEQEEMRKLIVLLLLLTLFSNIAVADCDFTTIKNLPNGNYEYSPQQHLCVGQLVQSDQVKSIQLKDLGAAIQLKDLALQKSDERIYLWRTTSYNEMDRMEKIESSRSTSNLLYFGLGALTVLGAGWMASKLLHP
jgi:hypothetical protein